MTLPWPLPAPPARPPTPPAPRRPHWPPPTTWLSIAYLRYTARRTAVPSSRTVATRAPPVGTLPCQEDEVQQAAVDTTPVPRGLTDAEVADRIERGLVNRAPGGTSRSMWAIVRANVFTRFNAILGGLLAVILTIGPIQDALFGIVLVTNTGIGIYQEWRAQRTPPQRFPPPPPAPALARR